MLPTIFVLQNPSNNDTVRLTGIWELAPMMAGLVALADLKDAQDRPSSQLIYITENREYSPLRIGFPESLSVLIDKYYLRDFGEFFGVVNDHVSPSAICVSPSQVSTRQ